MDQNFLSSISVTLKKKKKFSLIQSKYDFPFSLTQQHKLHFKGPQNAEQLCPITSRNTYVTPLLFRNIYVKHQCEYSHPVLLESASV